MACCKLLNDGTLNELPFGRTIATGYYDGPTDGITECSICESAYCFQKLDWDSLQDMRVYGFAELGTSLTEILNTLGLNEMFTAEKLILPDPNNSKIRPQLSALFKPPTTATAFEGWPGKTRIWRSLSNVSTSEIKDWFAFLNMTRG